MKQTRYLIFLVFVAIVLTGCSGGGGGSGVGGIIGLVTYEGSGLAVIDAYVEIAGRYAYTNADGSFRLNNIPAGAYTMTIRHPGIRDGRWTQSLTIPSWDTRSDVFRVPPRTMPVTTGDVGGWVYVPSRSQAMALGEIEPLIAKQMTAPSGYEPLRNAKVTIAGQTATTGNYGNFYFERVPAGYQTLTVSHASLRFPITRDINVLSGGVNWVGDHGTDYVVGGVGYYVTIGADKYYEDTTPLPGPRDDALAVHNELFNRNK
ncbi:MAG: carboxypeptidase-like regulatory domain-containing protein, partial [Limnochordia bacterium]|nr:carboxypeptidase-like regulatory domain-containing protein [Limnochordia bacterium]